MQGRRAYVGSQFWRDRRVPLERKAREQDWITRPVWQSGGREVTVHPHTGSREREREVRSD